MSQPHIEAGAFGSRDRIVAMPKLNVNNKSYVVNADPDTPLLWVLREELRLTGTKFGCGGGHCGACTVHVNGEAVRSCQLRIDDVYDSYITTIEGLSPGVDHPLNRRGLSTRCLSVVTASLVRLCIPRRFSEEIPIQPTRKLNPQCEVTCVVA